MRFFDANCFIGAPMIPGTHAPETAESLLAAMDRAGIERALVWHVAQRDYEPLAGNAMLAQEIEAHDRLMGVWTLLPTACGEIGEPDLWLEEAARRHVAAVRAFPDDNRYLLRAEALGDVLDALTERRIPLLLSCTSDAAWGPIYDLLAAFPKLTVILSDLRVWPCDRYFRPLLARYAGVHVETSMLLADGGIETFVTTCGPDRLIFGSGFPACYHGSAMLALAHADIDDRDKCAIASENLERLIGEARL